MLERALVALVLAALAVAIYRLVRSVQLHRASRATAPAGKLAVLYFGTDVCAPCTTQDWFLQQLQAQFGDQVVIEKIDADAEQETAARYGVFTVPTTLVVDADGRVRNANYGLADTRKLAAQLMAIGATN
jgi:thioredoxin 1